VKLTSYDSLLIQWVGLIACKDSNIVIVQESYRANESMLSTDRGRTWKDLKTGGWLFDGVYQVFIQDTIVWYDGWGLYGRLFKEGISRLMHKSYYLSAMVNQDAQGMAALNKYLYIVTDYKRVFRSSEEGESWEKMFEGLPKDTLFTVAAIGNDIYLGGNAAYVSRDYGKTWKSIGEGLPDYGIPDFIIVNNTLYVALYGGGVWYRSLSDIGLGTDDGDKALPVNYALAQNYPNPFSDQTMIKYTTPAERTVTITVHDMLGRHVSTLVSETKPSGQYETSFSGEGLSNGMYLCTLEADGARLVRKMVLFR
jgi:hypothetical protein